MGFLHVPLLDSSLSSLSFADLVDMRGRFHGRVTGRFLGVLRGYIHLDGTRP